MRPLKIKLYDYAGTADDIDDPIIINGKQLELILFDRLVIQVNFGRSYGRCPKCGRGFQTVAIGNGYEVVGCPEHREYDRVVKLS